MNERVNNQTEPLCRVGPGGDFVSLWPAENQPNSNCTTPIRVVKGDCRFSGEPMLFADDWLTGVRVCHKSKHSIRTYSRAAKKKSSHDSSGQGSLFEADFKSAKTA